MNAGPDVERRISAWLDEEVPTGAPDRVLATALERSRRMHQRRLGAASRTLPMSRTAYVAAAVITVVALGGLALLLSRSSEGPSVGAPATSPAAASAAAAPPTAAVTPASSPTASTAAVAPPFGSADWLMLEHLGNAPDGSTTGKGPEWRRLWLVHPNGAGLEPLGPIGGVEGMARPDWSPDGTKIAFASSGPAGRIWEVNVNGSGSRLVTQECIDPSECQETDPAYSPDGRMMAFVRLVGLTGKAPDRYPAASEVCIQYLDGSRLTCLGTTLTSTATSWIGQPDWSPDGTQLVFHRVHREDPLGDATASDLIILNINPLRERRLELPTGLTGGDPVWSPDGTRIAFASAPIHEFGEGRITPTDIYTVRPDGSDLRRLTENGGSGSPRWTRDGSHIVYFGAGTPRVMSSDGSDDSPIAKMPANSETTGWTYYVYPQPGL